MAVLAHAKGVLLGPGGQYRVVRVLGQGGFGITYLVEHVRLHRQFVVKEFAQPEMCARDTSTGDLTAVQGRESTLETWLERFEREAVLISSVPHRNIVRVSDVWREHGTAYYVMEYVEGAYELGRVCDPVRSPWPWERVERVAQQMLDALAAVHQAELMHGDVKPSNVLVDTSDHVTLIDFGTARQATELKRTVATAMYTRGWAPLELMSRDGTRDAGPWSDLYGWALTIASLMVQIDGDDGEPVDARTRDHVVRQGGRDHYQDIEERLVRAGVPAHWAAALSACCAIEATHRLRDVADVRHRLARPPVVPRQPVPPPPPPPPPPVPQEEPGGGRPSRPRPVRRRDGRRRALDRVLLAVMSTILVLGVALVVIGVMQRSESIGEAPPDEAPAPPPPALLAFAGIDPADAVVRVGDRVLTSWADELELTPGEVAIEITAPQFTTFTTTARLVEGETSTVPSVILERVCAPGFVLIEAGTFTMGSPDDENGRATDGRETQREVTLSRSFCLHSTEMTMAQWPASLGSRGQTFSACGPDCPVTGITWYDALAMANEMSQQEGLAPCYTLSDCTPNTAGSRRSCERVVVNAPGGDPHACEGYRLPTEAEWEYAARAGTDTATYVGDVQMLGVSNAPQLSEIAVYRGNSGVQYAGGRDCSTWAEREVPATICGPHPVASKAPNGWGLHDMLGNVHEWVWDAYQTTPSTERTDPWVSDGTQRIPRGGSYVTEASRVRASNRYGEDGARRYDNVGVRLARTAP